MLLGFYVVGLAEGEKGLERFLGLLLMVWQEAQVELEEGGVEGVVCEGGEVEGF